MLDRTAILERLIGFETVSDRSNLELIAFVESWLGQHGVASTRSYDASGEKANLLATIGPAAEGGLVLSGHTDVVPARNQAWSSDPFTLRIEEGKAFGRGTADMKGFLACVLALVPELKRMPLRAPVILAFSFDEEVGCKGVPILLDQMKDELAHPPAGCIVGEPTMMDLVDGHKGKVGIACSITGREAHSALTHEGANAVLAAGRLIGFIGGIIHDLEHHGPFAEGFVPPHSTASVGRIEGGGQLNIIPRTCRFEFEFRTLPDDDPWKYVERVKHFAENTILPGMRAVAPEASIEFETIISYPGFAASAGSSLVAACKDVASARELKKVPFGTEAGHFEARGIPSIVCGPGSIAVAHKPDEWIALDQLEACGEFLRAVTARLCG